MRPAALLCVLALLGCAKKPSPPPPPEERVEVESPGRGHVLEWARIDTPTLPPGPVHFDLNSCAITDTIAAQRLAEYVRERNQVTTLVGYACPLGSEAHNLDLGRRRALALRAYLGRAGVPKECMEATTQGERNPVTLDPAQYWRNRRVEVMAP